MALALLTQLPKRKKSMTRRTVQMGKFLRDTIFLPPKSLSAELLNKLNVSTFFESPQGEIKSCSGLFFHGQEDLRKGIDIEGRVLEPLESGDHRMLRETPVGIKNEGLVCVLMERPYISLPNWVGFGWWESRDI
jgi:hypothetical protein